MEPLKIVETDTGKYSLLLNAGTTPVDRVIEDELGYVPHGYFWDAIARMLTDVSLESRFGLDPESGMFCAYGTDLAALEELGSRMSAVATDASRIRELVAEGEARGVDFDD